MERDRGGRAAQARPAGGRTTAGGPATRPRVAGMRAASYATETTQADIIVANTTAETFAPRPAIGAPQAVCAPGAMPAQRLRNLLPFPGWDPAALVVRVRRDGDCVGRRAKTARVTVCVDIAQAYAPASYIYAVLRVMCLSPAAGSSIPRSERKLSAQTKAINASARQYYLEHCLIVCVIVGPYLYMVTKHC